MNRLEKEKSAYLRHAARQKIDWYPWSEEAFQRAGDEDKPVFLSSGAVWCHWCHVMAKESFDDDEVARLLREHFIAVKLDRDERPDIDRRYQRVVAAMGLGSGWPLSVFLTPGREAFYGGTYFPPDEKYGRPGFKDVLKMVAGLYETKRDEILAYSSKITDFFKDPAISPGEIGKDLIGPAARKIHSFMDHRQGGFGKAPKFPMSGAIESLLNRYALAGDKEIGVDLIRTLTAMAKGGFHDQLGMGFHRYSTDEAWIVPHFEKMADDNAWLLRNYAHAYAVFKIGYFKEVAEGIVSFMRRELTSPEGCFYASQDADVTPDDEGGYFTWTDEELKASLSENEYRVISRHLFGEKGAMHHDPAKHVLYVAVDGDVLTAETGLDRGEIDRTIRSGKAKLLEARERREKPFVDTALYTSLNGMCISAFIEAYRTLGDAEILAFALKSLDRLKSMRLFEDRVDHTEGVPGLLDDYVHFADALASAYEGTGVSSYADQARKVMDLCIDKFWDKKGGGFFDTETEVLGTRIKGVEDVPQPAANSVAVMVLIKLKAITGDERYGDIAERTLETFAKDAEAMGLHSGYYFCAMDSFFNGLKLEVCTGTDSALSRAARFTFHPYTTIVHGTDKGHIVACSTSTCYEPIEDPEQLHQFLAGMKEITSA